MKARLQLPPWIARRIDDPDFVPVVRPDPNRAERRRRTLKTRLIDGTVGTRESAMARKTRNRRRDRAACYARRINRKDK